MTQRTCSSCGAHVALVEDRCRACGRDPDLRLLELGAPTARPPSGPSRPRSVNWRRWAPVAAVGMALWAFLAFAGADDDEGIPVEEADGTTTTSEAEAEARTSTSRRAPTTTTTHVIPGAPLLGEPTGLEMVVVGVTGQVVDLDTGAVTRLRARAVGATARGILVEDDGDLATWPAPYDGSNATTVLAAVPGTVSDQLWVVGDGTMVWVLRRGNGSMELRPVPEVLLVDLDGEIVGRFPVPGEAWPVGATSHGLVVDGPSGVYLLDPTGTVERVSTGDASGVVGERIYASSCDEELQCRVEVLDGRGRLIEALPSPTENIGWAAAGPDGRVAFVVFDEPGESSRVTIDGVTVFEVDGIPMGPAALAWSPDGRWLAIGASDGLHVLDTLADAGEGVSDIDLVDRASSLFFVEPAG